MLERQGRGSKSAGVDLEQAFAAASVLEKGGKIYRIGFPPVTAIVAPDT
jgi:hypothetical protein